MDENKFMQEYLEMAEEMGKLSEGEQFVKMPTRLSSFFRSIFEDGFSKGLLEGQKREQQRQMKQN